MEKKVIAQQDNVCVEEEELTDHSHVYNVICDLSVIASPQPYRLRFASTTRDCAMELFKRLCWSVVSIDVEGLPGCNSAQ